MPGRPTPFPAALTVSRGGAERRTQARHACDCEASYRTGDYFGTARVCELNAEPLHALDSWLSEYRTFWKSSLVRLKAHVEIDKEMKRGPH